MKKFRLPALVLALALLLGQGLSIPARAVSDPNIDSSYAAILLADNGTNETVLYEKNAQDKMYPASLTKVMTVLLAIEAIDRGEAGLTDMVTAQPGFDFDMIIGGTSANIVAGETMSLENLLYCAMIASANEACNVIAMHISGTVSAFVEEMNKRAEELGCVYTHFTNTHGLPNPDHYTTAWDFSQILRAAASNELFMKICTTISYTVPDTNVSAARTLENTNSLINPTNSIYPGDYGYEYAAGVKTGHTSDAGYCLCSTAEKDGIRLLSVVMNSQAWVMDDGNWYYGHFADTRTLFEWGFANFSYQEIVRSTEIVTEVPVAMGADADSLPIRPSTSITALLPNDVDPADFTKTVTLYPEAAEGLTAPVSAGQAVGEITVTYNGESYGSAVLVTSTSVELSRTQYMKSQMAETLRQPAVLFTVWALALLFLLYLLLVIRYRAKRRAYQKRLEAARQVRLDLEDEEEEIRFERSVRKSRRAKPSPGKAEAELEPESAKEELSAEQVDEPTRVSTARHDERTDDTREVPAVPAEDGAEPAGRDYYEEFFGKKEQ